jgi:hypothetical protein
MPWVMMMGHRSRADVWANDVASLVLYCAGDGEHAPAADSARYSLAGKVSYSIVVKMLLCRGSAAFNGGAPCSTLFAGFLRHVCIETSRVASKLVWVPRLLHSPLHSYIHRPLGPPWTWTCCFRSSWSSTSSHAHCQPLRMLCLMRPTPPPSAMHSHHERVSSLWVRWTTMALQKRRRRGHIVVYEGQGN